LLLPSGDPDIFISMIWQQKLKEQNNERNRLDKRERENSTGDIHFVKELI